MKKCVGLTDSDAEIVADNAVHSDLVHGACVVAEHHAHCFLALLALDYDRVGAEQLQLVHFGLR